MLYKETKLMQLISINSSFVYSQKQAATCI